MSCCTTRLRVHSYRLGFTLHFLSAFVRFRLPIRVMSHWSEVGACSDRPLLTLNTT